MPAHLFSRQFAMSQPLSDFHSQSATGGPQPAVGAQPAVNNIAPGEENPYQSPEVTEPPEIEVEQAPTYSPLEAQIAVLMHQGKTGANWFYWIAALSVVNTLIMFVGGNIAIVFGLGVTYFGGAIAEVAAENDPQAAVIARVVGFGFTLFIALIFCGFGWLANKRFQSIFFIGMGLYLLDGLLFLPLQMWIIAASHAYAVYIMWGGFQAFRQLRALERKLMDPLHPVGEFNPHQVPTDLA